MKKLIYFSCNSFCKREKGCYICNRVQGNPPRFIGEMAEWSIAAVLKTVDCNRSGGSNPSFSAKKSRNVSFGFFYSYDVESRYELHAGVMAEPSGAGPARLSGYHPLFKEKNLRPVSTYIALKVVAGEIKGE